MKNIPIPLELTEQEALDLAQFVKRVGWQEMRQNAVDEDEAYRIREALDKVRKALADVGYSPR
jgi:cytochrome c